MLSVSNTVKVMDLMTEVQTHTLAGHTDRVSALNFNCCSHEVPEHNCITSNISLIVVVFLQILYATISADSRYVVSGSRDETVRLWELSKNGEMVYCFHAYSDVYKVRFCADDNKTIAALTSRFGKKNLMILSFHGEKERE